MSISDTTRVNDPLVNDPIPVHRDGVDVEEPKVHPEEPRRHPMAYLALALSTLALILSMAALMRDEGPDRIRVGNSECVVVDGQGDAPQSLFCNTTNVPAP